MSSTFSKAKIGNSLHNLLSEFVLYLLVPRTTTTIERERARAKTRKEKKRGWTSAFPDERVVAG